MNLGIGKDGSKVVFARKLRWTLSGDFPQQNFSESFVKINNRSALNVEETEVNYLGNKTWIPGKHKWETIVTTHYEIDEKHSLELFALLADFWENVTSEDYDPLKDADKHGTLHLKMYDGCGTLLEAWGLVDAYPKAFNFVELDHSSSEISTFEITWAYRNIKFNPTLEEANE